LYNKSQIFQKLKIKKFIQYTGWGNNFDHLEYHHYFWRYENIVITKVIGYQEDYNIC